MIEENKDEEVVVIAPRNRDKKPKPYKQYQNLYPQELIRHMEKGLSFASFASVVSVSVSSLQKWVEKYPAFKQAKEIGEAKSRYFWEATGIKGVHGQINNFSAAVWIFTMKCRFGYRDGSENFNGIQTDTKEEVVYQSRWGNLAIVPKEH